MTPLRPLRTSPPRTTLSRMWTGVVITMAVVVLGLGAIAFAATGYQRDLFTATTADLQRQSSAVVDINSILLAGADPMTRVIYRSGETARDLEDAERSYTAIATSLRRAFRSAAEAVEGTPAAAALGTARRSWEEMDAAVMSAEDVWATQDVIHQLSVGDDPFRTSVWHHYDEVQIALNEVREQMLVGFQQETARVDRSQDVLVVAVLVAVAVAVLGAWWTLRRMSQQVLQPLRVIGREVRAATDAQDVGRQIEVPGAAGEIADVVTALNDTNQALRGSHDQLRRQASTDAMTDLPNRRAFAGALETRLGGSHARTTGVLFIDLDDFKTVNDNLGHAAGDRLLQVVSRRLVAATRAGDLVARLGGDEFAIAADTVDVGMAIALAERVLAQLAEPLVLEGVEHRVSCSIGIAIAEPAAEADVVLGNADFAMYMAKGQGKDRYEVYAPALHTAVLETTRLREELAGAAGRDELELRYQPIVELDGERLLGFEALVRWNHPSRGVLMPAAFIDIAESTGVIVEIGTWVLDRACAALAEHLRHDPTLTMNVNVSPRQLDDPSFCASVTAALERHGVPASGLVIEITEASALRDQAAASAALHALRTLGVRIAMDDFGTGFSSIQHLDQLPIDVLKIDRTFVTGRTTERSAMLEALVTFAQGLGLSVVAEGIEEEKDMTYLRRFAHVAGQGYLFARPMSDVDAARFRDRASREVGTLAT